MLGIPGRDKMTAFVEKVLPGEAKDSSVAARLRGVPSCSKYESNFYCRRDGGK